MSSQLQAAIANEMGVDFNDYGQRAQRYLGRDVFKGTPLTGEMLAKAADQAYRKYGVMVPLELALAQAQFESGMGRKGRNPLTNPYNVGEYDAGTKMRFKDTSSGVNAYYDLMARDYLKKNTMDGLLKNFVNYQGNRYASNPDYEKNLSGQVGFIRNFLK